MHVSDSTDPDTLAEYQAAAADYDRRWADYVAATTAATLDAVRLPVGGALLDVGCGTGTLLHRAAERFPTASLAGADPSPAMLAVAGSKTPPTIDLREAAAAALPWPDGSFDAAVTASALHCWPDAAAGLREMRRVLRPGGVAVVTDWCADFPTVRLIGLWLRLTGAPPQTTCRSDRLRSLCEDAGLTVEGVRTWKADLWWGLATATATRDTR